MQLDGTVVDVEATGVGINYRGQPAVLALIRDIRGRKKGEAALRQQINFVNALLETLGALVVVLDREGRIVRFNQACEKTTGYGFEEVQGRVFFDLLLPPEEVEDVRRVFGKLRSGDFPSSYENHWLTKSGERRFIAWSNTAMIGAEGQVEYVIGTGLDITERRAAEEALRRSEEKQRAKAADLQAVLDATPAAVWLAEDPECHRVSGNRAAFEILRLPGGRNLSK